MLGSKPFSSRTLSSGGIAIRWVSGAYPAPDTEMLDWIKLASTVINRGDINEYKYLMLSRSLSLAYLGLQSLWDFPRTQFPSLPFLSFWVEGSMEKLDGLYGEILRWMSIHLEQCIRYLSSNERGNENCTSCGLGQRGAQCASQSMSQVIQ